MQAFTHETIETRAYQLWEEAGRPFGRSEEFWFQASTELATVKPIKKAASKSKAATTAKTKAVAGPAAKAKKTAAPSKKAAAKKSN